jgi:radical SAM protein with 4Fe4S-binding SPASM domain
MPNLPDNFCSAPWSAVYVDPLGYVGPCCIYSMEDETAYGNLNNDSITNIINSDNARTLKLQLINNERPAGCKNCWKNDDANLISFRHSWNKRDNKQIEDFLNYTSDTGDYNYSNINYWDIRPSNLCNLGCIMCTPRLSSGLWQLWSDLEMLGKHNVKKFKKMKKDDIDLTLQYIKEKVSENHSNGINDHFYFAGGEPMIMPEHKKIIDMLEQENFYHVSLRYNTNLTAVVFKGINWLDKWKKFQNKIIIDASIDSTGDTAGIQRVGTDWSVIKNNLKLIAASDNIKITFNIVVSILTYPVLIDTLIELEEIFGNEYMRSCVKLTPLRHPEYLCLNSIPDNHIDYSIIHKVNEMGYDVSELGSLLRNREKFVTQHDMQLIDATRNKLFNRLYKIKNIDVRNILPWFVLDE